MNLQISSEVKLYFTSINNEPFNKELLENVVNKFLHNYSDLIKDPQKAKSEELQDIFNYALLETKTKQISTIYNKKKI